MMKKIAYSIIANILIASVFLIGLNFFLVVGYSSYTKVLSICCIHDLRGDLPNYDGVEWAKTHFDEVIQSRSEYKSYVGWQRLPFQGKTIAVNDQGLRYTPQSKLATDESKKVVFLGGSTMWGLGVNNENTIPAIFAKISQREYMAINMGECGYRALQSYLRLMFQMDNGFHPDIVVSYDGINESLGFLKKGDALSQYREWHFRYILNRYGEKTDQHLNFRSFFLGPTEEFIQKLLARMRKVAQDARYELSEERFETVARGLLNSWMKTKELAEKNKALFVAVLQPNASIGNPNVENIPNRDKDMDEIFPKLYSKIRKLIKEDPSYKELEDNFLDLSNVLNKEEFYYIDGFHLSPNGNEVIAREIYKYLSLRDKKTA